VTEQARYPLNTIVTMLESGNDKLNPEFQRRHRWAVEKQSRLIAGESEVSGLIEQA
jgi:hypothetical protein